MAQRILGMGDVMTLVEKAERQIDERSAQALEKKIRQEQFTLDDFLEQMQQVRKMGPLGSLLKMMPGMSAQLGNLNVDEERLDRLEAIIRSMTPQERANPRSSTDPEGGGSRGSGTSVQAVSHLVEQFSQMKKLMTGGAREDAFSAATGRRSLTSRGRMSVRVRLTRVGSKKNPIWRVVVADQRSPPRWPLHRDDRPLQPPDRAVAVTIDLQHCHEAHNRRARSSNWSRRTRRASARIPRPRLRPPIPAGDAAADAGVEPEATDDVTIEPPSEGTPPRGRAPADAPVPDDSPDEWKSSDADSG